MLLGVVLPQFKLGHCKISGEPERLTRFHQVSLHGLNSQCPPSDNGTLWFGLFLPYVNVSGILAFLLG